jgi:hypothetical protein
MQAEGLVVDRVEAKPDGTFVFVPRDATSNASTTTIEARPTDKKNEWDE